MTAIMSAAEATIMPKMEKKVVNEQNGEAPKKRKRDRLTKVN